jgi:hypothetical protein
MGLGVLGCASDSEADAVSTDGTASPETEDVGSAGPSENV